MNNDFNIVPTNVSYGYDIMKDNIVLFEKMYNFLEFGSIGESVLKKDIPYIKLGNGKNQLCYSASIHANEWITSVILMKFVEDFCKAFVNNTELYGYNVRKIYDKATIYVIPMLNPDGVDLVIGNVTDNKVLDRTKEISDKYPNIPYPKGWKANIEGIDLNLQFPARWDKAKEIKYAKGFTTPAPRDFVGYKELTAIECINLYNFTKLNKFEIILNYHSQGSVIYWKYSNYTPDRSLEIGKEFEKASGYELKITPSESSFAGYKDWFIQEYNKPGYTIEVGIGINPLPISQFDEIYKDNLPILILGAVLI